MKKHRQHLYHLFLFIALAICGAAGMNAISRGPRGDWKFHERLQAFGAHTQLSSSVVVVRWEHI